MVTIKSYRDTWAEVNLRAISENVRAISKLHENVHMMAIVKANGYGHGAVEVAKVALQSGATYLGVALLEEAIELRDAGIKAPILLFGRIRPEYVPIAAAYNVIVTVFQLDWLLEAKKYLKENMRVHVHVKFDTGMGRVGIRTKEEAAPILQFIRDDQSFYLHGIYTHFATADEHDLTYMHKQHNRFVEM